MTEVDLVLTGAGFVVGGFWQNPHGLQRQADFPTHVFPFVHGENIHVPGFILGNHRGMSLIILLEEIEFIFRAEAEEAACFQRLFIHSAQNGAAVAGKQGPLRRHAVAQHAHHTTGLRTPRQHC